MKGTKILLGLTTLVVILVIGQQLLALTNVDPGLFGSSPSLLIALVAAFAGGFIARKGMLTPTLLLLLGFWTYVTYVLYAIAVPTGTADLMSIIMTNLMAILGSVAMLGFGIHLGQLVSTRRFNANATAT